MAHIVEKDWVTKAGLRAVILITTDERERHMHRCGYLALPDTHRFARIKDEYDPLPNGEYLDSVAHVHGGWTFARRETKYPVVTEQETMWIGFDCAHSGDADIEPHPKWPRNGVVRSHAYCVAELERAAVDLLKPVNLPT